MKQTIKTVFIILIALFFTTHLSAALPPLMPNDPEAAPVDGGLSLLIVSGVGYGVRKVHAKRMSNRHRK